MRNGDPLLSSNSAGSKLSLNGIQKERPSVPNMNRRHGSLCDCLAKKKKTMDYQKSDHTCGWTMFTVRSVKPLAWSWPNLDSFSHDLLPVPEQSVVFPGNGRLLFHRRWKIHNKTMMHVASQILSMQKMLTSFHNLISSQCPVFI